MSFRTRFALPGLFAALLVAPAAYAGTAEVTFIAPDHFTDAGPTRGDSKERAHTFRELQKHVAKLAERLPQGLLTDIGGQSYGEALLAPTVLYSPVTEALAAAGIVPHYSANITGHGWRKLMRHPKALTYHIDALPAKTAVLEFMQRECGLDDHEAYGTLNMGAGFALYLAADDAARAVEIAQGLGIAALVAGRVEAGPKRVVIAPLGVAFAGDELQLR